MTIDQTRLRLLEQVALEVPYGPRCGCVVMVAVDGCDGAGKTMFAAELAEVLQSQHRAVIQATLDDFHNPRTVRYRRGADSAEGYWLDAFNYAALRAKLLDPLRDGEPRYRPAVHDLATDRPVDHNWLTAPAEAVLLIDGVFLHRDELADYWTYSVFLDVDEPTRTARMLERDGHLERLQRYLDAQGHYLTSCKPETRASTVIDNSDLANPNIRLSR